MPNVCASYEDSMHIANHILLARLHYSVTLMCPASPIHAENVVWQL
jgi:hypothetical protein